MTEAPVPLDTLIRFTPEELDLMRTALRLLLSTLGRNEADELAEVHALLRKLDGD